MKTHIHPQWWRFQRSGCVLPRELGKLSDNTVLESFCGFHDPDPSASLPWLTPVSPHVHLTLSSVFSNFCLLFWSHRHQLVCVGGPEDLPCHFSICYPAAQTWCSHPFVLNSIILCYSEHLPPAGPAALKSHIFFWACFPPPWFDISSVMSCWRTFISYSDN